MSCSVALRLLTSVVMVLSAPVAGAGGTVTVDFESLTLNELDPVTTQVPFLTIDGAVLAISGAPAVAFGGSAGPDMLVGEAFGQRFLTDPAESFPATPIEIVFDQPVDDLSVELGDIDQGETMTVRTSDALGAGLETIDVMGSDGVATLVAFALDGIKRVTFEPSSNAGYGVDNLTFADPAPPVPALGPNALAVLIAALLVSAGLSRSRRRPRRR